MAEPTRPSSSQNTNLPPKSHHSPPPVPSSSSTPENIPDSIIYERQSILNDPHPDIVEEGSDRSTNVEPTVSGEEVTSLIPGLHDDVAIRCLARVPRAYHAELRCVSRRWRHLVCGEEWCNIRKKYNLEETWIYALCEEGYEEEEDIPKYCCYVLDPYAPIRSWKRIQDLPSCIVQRRFMSFEVLGHKAYLIGGRDFPENEWLDNDVSTEDSDNSLAEDDSDGDIPIGDSDDSIRKIADQVHCYDAISNTWSEAASLSTPRCSFVSGVLDGKIYALGSPFNPDSRHIWETYDPNMDAWRVKSDNHMMDHPSVSIVYNGKLYVRYLKFDNQRWHYCGAVYDPSNGIWGDVDNNFLSGWCNNLVVADGRLFAFDLLREFVVKTWDEDRKEWMLMGNVSSLRKPGSLTSYRLAAIGKNIFFIAAGLFTAVLDVSNVAAGGELLISHVTQPIAGIIPLICKCMTI